MRFAEDRLELYKGSDGLDRNIHIWETKAPKAVLLTVHGLMDHGGNYQNLGLAMKKSAFVTVAYNQHGHHHKRKAHVPRFRVFLDDLDMMLQWVKREYRDVPIFVIGHSMGGLIVSHWVLKRFQGDPLVRGFMLSSPGFKNSLKTSGALIAMGKIMSVLTPRLAVPIADLRPHVTRDKKEFQRMRRDEADGIQATQATARLTAEFLSAQAWVPDHIGEWNYPLLAIISGDDRLIDASFTRSLLGRIDSGLYTEVYYPENYHESFNEINREEVFAEIGRWAEALL